MKMASKNLEFKLRQNRMNAVSDLAAEILLGAELLSIPVDPLALAATESRWLTVKDGNLKDSYDGLLEYHAARDRFLLVFNNKYDLEYGRRHPRTRFSIAHELGHFYIDHHRAYLMSGGKSHRSRGEFATADNDIVEREADAFAAGLLMPSPLLRPVVNRAELTLETIKTIANQFETSFLSTAIRCVQHSDFPCEVLGIRGGQIAWRFRPNVHTDPLTEGKCYPAGNGPLRSRKAREVWTAFEHGEACEQEHDGSPQDWFQVFGPQDRTLTVWEQYLPMPSMRTLVVLLTVSESELFTDSDDIDTE